MDYFKFYDKIITELIDIGFKSNSDKFKLGPYVIIIHKDNENPHRFGIEKMNINNIDNDNINSEDIFTNGDIIRSTTWFNLRFDSDKEINRRFGTIINRIKMFPKYDYYLRTYKIEKLKEKLGKPV